jgi:DNA-binding NarL/FixJ family response regulator
MLNSSEVTTILHQKNCFRCGDEFRAPASVRVCPACRTPKVSGRKPLSRELSLREEQIVDLVSQAKLNKEIAYVLHLSEGTVKEYMNRIFRKLGVTNRTELAIWALTRRTAAA